MLKWHKMAQDLIVNKQISAHVTILSVSDTLCPWEPLTRVQSRPRGSLWWGDPCVLSSNPCNGRRPIKSNDPPHVIETFCAVIGYFTSLQLSFADISDICWWALHGIFECNRKDNPCSQVGGGIRWNMPVSRKNNILSKWNKRTRITCGKYLHSLNWTSCYCLWDSRIFNKGQVRIKYKSHDFLGTLLEAWD